MPSSLPKIISPIVEYILKIQPQYILDIGIGFGKYGFLCREYLEGWKDRVFPEQWQIKVIGIEIFKEYVDKLTWLKKVYNEIKIGNAVVEIDNFADNYFDLIIANDVVEHLEKSQGQFLLEKIMRKTKKNAIVNLPLGEEWLNNKVVANNSNEKHQASWTINEVENIIGVNNIENKIEWAVGTRKGCLFFIKKG